MSVRSIIIADAIDSISADTASRGYRGFRYMHELNDFPCFCLHTETETRAWTDQRYGILKCSLRGYQHSDNLDDIETYTRAIEASLQRISRAHRPRVEDVRVISVRTDEGIFAPYGIVDMSVEILYRYEQPQGVTADSTLITADNTHITGDDQ